MPGRKQLNNLACGIAGRFASRNNDMDGYWALGLLYAAADAAATNKVRLDLISQTATPPFQYSARLVSQHSQYLQLQLARINLVGYVFSATIDVEFNVPTLPGDSIHETTWGEPFRCCVTLTDDLGRQRIGVRSGWCGIHDPNRECRSTRPHTS